MQLDFYPDYLHAVQDLKKFLQVSSPSSTVWKFEGEIDPLAIDLSFEPPISEKTVEDFIDSDVCTLCARRIGYKPTQFLKPTIRRPYLIIVHNSFILGKDKVFEEGAANSLFKKMIKAGLNAEPQDFLVREVLRCYFGKEDESVLDNQQNCLTHMRRDIVEYNIKGILIIGQAATKIFGTDQEKLKKISGKVIEYEGLPTVVTSGPERIIYMLQKKVAENTLQQQKAKILEHLQLFRKNIMKDA